MNIITQGTDTPCKYPLCAGEGAPKQIQGDLVGFYGKVTWQSLWHDPVCKSASNITGAAARGSDFQEEKYSWCFRVRCTLKSAASMELCTKEVPPLISCLTKARAEGRCLLMPLGCAGDTCGSSCGPFAALSGDSVTLHTSAWSTDYQLVFQFFWGDTQNGAQKEMREEGEKIIQTNIPVPF